MIISLLLISWTIFNIGNTLLKHKEQYVSNYWNRFDTLQQIYLDSQYVKKNPKGWVPDEFINAYAGGSYIRGTSPILIAPDTPPFGRYLIGLSTLLFNNENSIVLFSAIVSLIFLYLIGRQIFSHSVTSLLGVALVSSELIFKNQLVYTPLLDIMQLMFLLIGFYCFNKGLNTTKHLIFFVLSSIFLGFFISTKFFATGITIIIAYYAILIIHKEKKKILSLTTSIPISIAILLLTYIRVLFEFRYTLLQFLGIQKWVFLYHKSQLILPFTIWPLILFNKWYVWHGDKPIISDPQWKISWPFITIVCFITIGLYLFKKIKHKIEVEVIMAWTLLYMLFFSFGQISARYFVILIPILYLIALYGIEQFFDKKIVLKIKL